MRKLLLLFLCLPLCLGSSCKDKKRLHKHFFQAKHFHRHSCAACGMIIREQSSPRGQLIHQNGKRFYFCSLSDMVTYLQSPSPHGAVKTLFVEGMKPDRDPRPFDTSKRPWVAADKATFVLGVVKKRVMGLPILSFQSQKDAAKWAKKLDGKLTSWKSLLKNWKYK